MATPRGNGLVEINSGKSNESGFGCMKLIEFLTQEGVTDWDEWHYRHNQASRGECHYKDKCPIHQKTASKFTLKEKKK